MGTVTAVERPATDPVGEEPGYLTQQLLTYIGNKRALLGPIGEAVTKIKTRLGKKHIRAVDVFSGSGVVSRLLKAHASHLVSNDLEAYAAVTGRCFLSNRSAVDYPALSACVEHINRAVATGHENHESPGFIEELYAPRDENSIGAEERVFYTRSNARRLDQYRRLVDQAPLEFRNLLMGPLLSAASVHANTAGVFKGFYKNRETGIGQFGGSGKDALSRIRREIVLSPPVLSRFECEYTVLQQDANQIARELQDMDLAYIDPPYNQHPYGSNYFMLNLLTHYQRPGNISTVSGIPSDWQRSGYNRRADSVSLMTDLVEQLDSRFLLVSFNNEGFISPAEMRALLGRVGDVEEIEIRYNAFRGSRSLRNRPVHVTEHLFLVEKKS